MTRHTESLDATYFDRLYGGDPDPWRFETSAYEAGKYAATLEALPPGPLERVFEIGCSIGVLTAQLAPRCTELLAADISEPALARARARCAALPHVRLVRMAVPNEWPDGSFDLILLSEVVYYLVPADIAALARRVAATLRPGGHAVLVHWTGETNYPVSGDDAVRLFAEAAPSLLPDGHRKEAEYRLDRFRAA